MCLDPVWGLGVFVGWSGLRPRSPGLGRPWAPNAADLQAKPAARRIRDRPAVTTVLASVWPLVRSVTCSSSDHVRLDTHYAVIELDVPKDTKSSWHFKTKDS